MKAVGYEMALYSEFLVLAGSLPLPVNPRWRGCAGSGHSRRRDRAAISLNSMVFGVWWTGPPSLGRPRPLLTDRQLIM